MAARNSQIELIRLFEIARPQEYLKKLVYNRVDNKHKEELNLLSLRVRVLYSAVSKRVWLDNKAAFRVCDFRPADLTSRAGKYEQAKKPSGTVLPQQPHHLAVAAEQVGVNQHDHFRNQEQPHQ